MNPLTVYNILQHNVFCFNGQLYMLNRGTAMGTRFAPSYANLYMGDYEVQYISKHPWKSSIFLYRRYIDDLVFIWNDSEEEFHNFTNFLNENDWGLTLCREITVLA